jgi:hypothetical protein
MDYFCEWGNIEIAKFKIYNDCSITKWYQVAGYGNEYPGGSKVGRN